MLDTTGSTNNKCICRGPGDNQIYLNGLRDEQANTVETNNVKQG